LSLLIVEDDAVLRDGLMRSLVQSGYDVDVAATGFEADHLLATRAYDLIILDLALPGMDGLEVLRRLRGRGAKFPVLILTARDGLRDRVDGLDLGADDYLTKPFALPELEARLRALLRRTQVAAEPQLFWGPLRLDAVGRQAFLNGSPMVLTARELAVLELLMQRGGRVVSKGKLVEHLCGWDEEIGPNAIEVYVHRLRRKLEPAGVTIRTVRGLGYLLQKPSHG
jgi:DNA-binding response OmpR family regulator